MKPKWLIEDFDEGNRYHVLAEEVRRQGMECELITYVPFEQGNYNRFSNDECVIVQSSINLAQQLLREKEWVPNAWLNTQAYECTKYYAYLGEYLFNDDYTMMPRSEVKRNINRIFKRFGVDGCVFMRPSSGLKSFTGKVFKEKYFERDWEWVKEFTDPESIVVVSTPKDMLGEWRVIIADKQPIAWSQYKTLNRMPTRKNTIPDEAKKLAKEIASAGYETDPMYSLDICQGADEKYYLLEIGSFSCAGIYLCDVEPVVEAAAHIAEREWKEVYGRVA